MRRRSANTGLITSALLLTALTSGGADPAAAQAEPDLGEGLTLQPVTDTRANSPKEDLRKKIFGDSAAKAGCVALPVDPARGTRGLAPDLDSTLQAIMKHVSKQDEKSLLPLFHPRLKVALPAVAQTLAKIGQTYATPLDVTIFRLWALNTVDGAAKGVPCDEQITVYPQYGYPLQFAAWLQVMGQREIGRIYVALVPTEGEWRIGAFHSHQWTHASRDHAAWFEEGQKQSHHGLKEAAYVLLDLAVKLLDGGRFLDFSITPDVVKARDAVMAKADWDKAVRAALPETNIVYTSSLLVPDGAGVLIRVRTDVELSVESIKKTCQEMGRQLAKQKWAAPLKGLRCGFNGPKENPAADGALGGIYYSFEEIRAAK